MKRNLIVIGAFVFATLLLGSCGSNGNSGSAELKTEPKKDSVVVKKDAATVKTEDFKLQIFCKNIKSKKVLDENSINNTGEYFSYCTALWKFERFDIKGKGENVSALLYKKYGEADSTVLFKKDNIKIDSVFSITNKDFKFGENDAEVYCLKITQGQNVVISKKVMIACDGVDMDELSK